MDEITFKCKVLEETFSLSLPQNSTIENAKIMLESLSLGIKNFAQKWIFQGRILKDTETLQVSIQSNYYYYYFKINFN